MKTIHLKCGHRIQVKTWPSKAGLAKVRHHYKKFHPGRMRKMTKKSLATKRKKKIYAYERERGRFPIRSKKELSRFLRGNRCNPRLKWYAGYPHNIGEGVKLFSLSKKPTKKSHGNKFRRIVGPFKNHDTALKYLFK